MTNTTAARTYTATLPNGDTITRTTRSARLFYTHVRVVTFSNGSTVPTWHTSEALAANGRSDHDPKRLARWDVIPATLVGAEAPAAEAPAQDAPIGHGDLPAGAKLGTIGRSSRTVHLVFDWDGERHTACPSSVSDRRAYGTVYDRDAVVTCKRCVKAHRGA